MHALPDMMDESTRLLKVGQIQIILGVKVDSKWGPITQKALDAIKYPAAADLPPEPPTLSGDAVDARSEENIATLHPKVQPLARKLIRLAVEQGMMFKITSGLRTYAEQNALYEQGRSKPGPIVTNARGGQSAHNFGTAFDCTLFNGSAPVWDSPKYTTLGKLAESIWLSWGGNWSKPDLPHYYLKPPWAFSMSEQEMMAELRRRHDNRIDVFFSHKTLTD